MKKLLLLVLVVLLIANIFVFGDEGRIGDRSLNRTVFLDGPALIQSSDQCALLFDNTGSLNNQENFVLWNTGGKLNLNQFLGYSLSATLLSVDWASGNVGIGVDPTARLQLQGRDEIMATGYASVLIGETEVTGFNSSFTEMHEGDVIRLEDQDTVVWKIIVDIQNDELLYVDSSFDNDTDIINSVFYYKQPITSIVDSSSNSQVFVNALGNVGIGTMETEGKLEVVSPNYPPLKVDRITSDTTFFRGIAKLIHTTDQDMNDGFGARLDFFIEDQEGIENAIGHIGAVRDGADNSGKIQIWTKKNGAEDVSVVVNKDGNVGIGTTLPQSRLHIDGSSAGTFNRVLRLANSDTTPNNTTVLDFWAASQGGMNHKSFVSLVAEFPNHTFASEEGVFHIYTRNGHNHEPRLTINSTGNVGINTIEPENKLHVNGAINLDPIAEPASPTTGFVLYVDSVDGDLKAKSHNGNITRLAFD